MTTYKNPWHKPAKPEYGPAVYETNAEPEEYGGYLIYEREPGQVWDIVKHGVCVAQMAGPNGARKHVDWLNSLLPGPEGPGPEQTLTDWAISRLLDSS